MWECKKCVGVWSCCPYTYLWLCLPLLWILDTTYGPETCAADSCQHAYLDCLTLIGDLQLHLSVWTDSDIHTGGVSVNLRPLNPSKASTNAIAATWCKVLLYFGMLFLNDMQAIFCPTHHCFVPMACWADYVRCSHLDWILSTKVDKCSHMAKYVAPYATHAKTHSAAAAILQPPKPSPEP